jgi:hypothetical protein
MSDFKIGPPGAGGAPSVDRLESTDGACGPAGSGEAQATAAIDGHGTTAGSDAAALVERIRSGELDAEAAAASIVDGVLAANPALAASEALRGEARRALVALVATDPTLRALTGAMKR